MNTMSGVARYLSASQAMMDTAAQRLASGKRINSSRDDTAGLAIATRMESQMRGMSVALRNARDAGSMTQVADKGLESAVQTAQRMRELAVKAANSASAGDVAVLQDEYQKLGTELKRNLGNLTFNGKAVFGADAGVQNFQVGANGDAADVISVTSSALASDADIVALASASITDSTTAQAQLAKMDTVLDKLSTERTKFGAAQSRVELTSENLQSQLDATTAAHDRIMDVDFATETANFSKGQLLQQAAISMMSQANASRASLLSLLRF